MSRYFWWVVGGLALLLLVVPFLLRRVVAPLFEAGSTVGLALDAWNRSWVSWPFRFVNRILFPGLEGAPSLSPVSAGELSEFGASLPSDRPVSPLSATALKIPAPTYLQIVELARQLEEAGESSLTSFATARVQLEAAAASSFSA